MIEQTVGIRELKANLRAYLSKVKKGQTIIITSHGEVMGQLMPRKADDDVETRMKALVKAGVILWNGKKPVDRKPTAINRGDKQASDIIVEMRNESLF
jgi:prevent-host-death family protein